MRFRYIIIIPVALQLFWIIFVLSSEYLNRNKHYYQENYVFDHTQSIACVDGHAYYRNEFNELALITGDNNFSEKCTPVIVSAKDIDRSLFYRWNVFKDYTLTEKYRYVEVNNEKE